MSRRSSIEALNHFPKSAKEASRIVGAIFGAKRGYGKEFKESEDGFFYEVGVFLNLTNDRWEDYYTWLASVIIFDDTLYDFNTLDNQLVEDIRKALEDDQKWRKKDRYAIQEFRIMEEG